VGRPVEKLLKQFKVSGITAVVVLPRVSSASGDCNGECDVCDCETDCNCDCGQN